MQEAIPHDQISDKIEGEEEPPSIDKVSIDKVSIDKVSSDKHPSIITSTIICGWLKRFNTFKWLGRFIPAFAHKEAPNLRESLDEILEEFDEDATIDPQGRTLIENILKLNSKTAYDVMIPRADIVAFPLNSKLENLIPLLIDKPHSRYPVYDEDMDDIKGMIHIKDVFAANMVKDRPVSLKKIMRQVLFVAPKKPVLELLLDMRSAKRHVALVVDEYGGIDGLITIEDLVEEIVGQIEDEHDVENNIHIITQKDGIYIANARILLEDLEQQIGQFMSQAEREEDIDTLGGLIYHLCGRVPMRGEIIKHPDTQIEFLIYRADARRIKTVHIRLGASK